MENPLSFSRLELAGWCQFDSVDIEIHPRLTILTGANGSGKSTLINIFSTHFGWSRPFLGTPRRSKDGGYTYGAGIFKSLLSKFRKPQNNVIVSMPAYTGSTQDHVGSLKYTNGVSCELSLYSNNAAQYSLNMMQQQPVIGLHVDSYRPTPRYQPVPSIQIGNIDALTAYNIYNSELMQFFGGGYTGNSPIFTMKEALITMALLGEGNIHLPGNPTLKRLFVGFSEVLSRFLPDSIGFKEISIRVPDVVLVTKSGNFMIDASSGGLMALVDLAWRIYMFSQDKQHFVVTMDEPENHLHPSMQRILMQRLISAFPKAQFIVATHSPFIVSAVKDSFVYVLRHSEDKEIQEQLDDTEKFGRKVYSQKLESINKAGSAGDILREVLGVSVTMPEWVENDVNQVVSEFRNKQIDVELLSQLRARLSSLGFGEYYPSALASLTNQYDKIN